MEAEKIESLRLKWDGHSGDKKRAFVVAESNNGWEDLRIEVDTDDCDGDYARRAMQVVIDRVNACDDELVGLRAENKFLHDLLDGFEWQRINAMSAEEVRKELLAEGYTEERLNASFSKIQGMIAAAKAKREDGGEAEEAK